MEPMGYHSRAGEDSASNLEATKGPVVAMVGHTEAGGLYPANWVSDHSCREHTLGRRTTHKGEP